MIGLLDLLYWSRIKNKGMQVLKFKSCFYLQVINTLQFFLQLGRDTSNYSICVIIITEADLPLGSHTLM